MDNYSPLCAFVTIFEVFCLEIVTSVYHWRNIFPRAWTVIHPWWLFTNAAIFEKSLDFEGGRGDSEYGLLVVLSIHIAASCSGYAKPYLGLAS